MTRSLAASAPSRGNSTRRLRTRTSTTKREDASDESASGSGSEDDDAYESSFVTDGSGSEYEDDEAEWTPRKRAFTRSRSASPLPEEPSAGFLHMEEFEGLPPARRAEPADGADAAALSDADAASPVAAEREPAATGGFLHAEELESPPGFYNLWVL